MLFFVYLFLIWMIGDGVERVQRLLNRRFKCRLQTKWGPPERRSNRIPSDWKETEEKNALTVHGWVVWKTYFVYRSTRIRGKVTITLVRFMQIACVRFFFSSFSFPTRPEIVDPSHVVHTAESKTIPTENLKTERNFTYLRTIYTVGFRSQDFCSAYSSSFIGFCF